SADACVASTNSNLALGRTGHRLAEVLGPSFGFERINKLSPLPLGRAAVLEVQGVAARYVILTPIYDAALSSPTPNTVAQGVLAALREAERVEDVRSIVIPSIGTTWGQLFAINSARRVVETVFEYVTGPTRLEEITFCNPDPKVHAAYQEV